MPRNEAAKLEQPGNRLISINPYQLFHRTDSERSFVCEGRCAMPGLNLQPHNELDLAIVFTPLVEQRFEHRVNSARELRTT